MGKLTETLDEFSSISREYYQEIQEILRDEYCWKCPMRSTSGKTNCRDIDAWIRLTGAFERGIHHYHSKDDLNNNIEAITSRYLSKIMKKHTRNLKFSKTVILKLNENVEPFAMKGDLLFVRENPESIKAGDIVLWPEICPISIYWFSKAKVAGYIPFNILKVSKTFHKEECRYIQAENGIEIPLEYITGKIIKIIDKNDDIYSKLNL